MGKGIFCCKAVFTEISGINVIGYKNIDMEVTHFSLIANTELIQGFVIIIFSLLPKNHTFSPVNCLVSYPIYMYSVPVYTCIQTF